MAFSSASGRGAACTTREVVGVGVPQVTATMECAAARQEYFNRTGRYVPIITDGGLRTGGDVCKAVASGADGVMLGTPFAQAEEAPGRGFNWGMANSHPNLPRGTRIKVGTKGTLNQILFRSHLRHRRHPEPRRRTQGRHGHVRCHECPGVPAGRHGRRPLHKDRGQSLPVRFELEGFLPSAAIGTMDAGAVAGSWS